MKSIKFTQNWNNAKLNLNCFSTIRLMQPKYQRGESYKIVYEAKGIKPLTLGYAQIALITNFKLAHLTEGMALMDTGYGKADCERIIKTMYQGIKDWNSQWLSFIILKYYERWNYAPLKMIIPKN